MLRRSFLLPILLAVPATMLALPARADLARPTGLFVLSDPSPVSSVTSLLAKTWVDGYAQRLTWTAFEPSPGTYDFSRIDSIVAVARPLHKRFSLSILAAEAPPDLVAGAGAETVTVRIGSSAKVTVLPWNTAARTRWNAFLAALSAHPVRDDAAGGAFVPLRDHSLLLGLSGVPYGMNGIRDIGGFLRTHPLYERDSLIAGVMRGQQSLVDAFPQKFAWLAFFRMSDATASPAADVQLLDSLRARFWNGGGPPRLGLFQENFACTTPNASFAFALAQEQNETWIAFQALQPWISPFSNPAATDPCLVTTVAGDRSTATSGPEVGLHYVHDAFRADYVEVYKADLQHAAFEDEFSAFWAELHAAALVAPPSRAPAVRVSIWPNPARGPATVELSLPSAGEARVEVLDAAGRRVRTLAAGAHSAGVHRIGWDGLDDAGRVTRPGFYVVRAHGEGWQSSGAVVRR